MPECEIAERFAHLHLFSGLAIEINKKTRAIDDPIQTKRKTVSVARRRYRVRSSDFFAVFALYHRDKLPGGEGEVLDARNFEFEVMHLRRKLSPGN